MDDRTAAGPAKTIGQVLADNLRGLRLLRRLEQEHIAEQMRRLGHRWSRATVSQVERYRRNVTVNELLGLSIVLEVPMLKLTDPTPLEGGDPPALDIGLPAPMPPSIVRQWADGRVTIFVESERGPDGTPRLRFSAVGRLAPETVGEGSP
jgi:transcriptional regulator with XRE-family HTH domain